MLDVCDPRVIRALLEKYGFHFSKAKGQNFLTQRWVPQRIAQEAGIDRSTGVLEIGPGFGPLTQELRADIPSTTARRRATAALWIRSR